MRHKSSGRPIQEMLYEDAKQRSIRMQRYRQKAEKDIENQHIIKWTSSKKFPLERLMQPINKDLSEPDAKTFRPTIGK